MDLKAHTQKTFTDQFWQTKFPGWKNPYTRDHLLQHFWTTAIPAVNLDIKIRTSNTLDTIERMQDQFVKVDTQTNDKLYKTKWYERSREQGWKLLGIIPRQGGIANVDLASYQVRRSPEYADNREHFCDFIDQMESKGLIIKELKIWKLEPNGWLVPHRDILTTTICMNYFWIPINDVPASSKIWPLGENKVCQGQVSLLCNQNFVHSVVNNSNRPRYVAAGRLDVDLTSREAYLHMIDKVLE